MLWSGPENPRPFKGSSQELPICNRRPSLMKTNTTLFLGGKDLNIIQR